MTAVAAPFVWVTQESEAKCATPFRSQIVVQRFKSRAQDGRFSEQTTVVCRLSINRLLIGATNPTLLYDGNNHRSNPKHYHSKERPKIFRPTDSKFNP